MPRAKRSVILKRLYGASLPPINSRRPLGNSEVNQQLIHLGQSDLCGPDGATVGIPVNIELPQLSKTISSTIVGQFRFGKGGRSKKMFGPLLRGGATRISIKERVTPKTKTPTLVVRFY